jgi:hypothetical protein
MVINVHYVLVTLLVVYLVVIQHFAQIAIKVIILMLLQVHVNNAKHQIVRLVQLMYFILFNRVFREQDVLNVSQDILLTTIQTYVHLVKMDVVLVPTME